MGLKLKVEDLVVHKGGYTLLDRVSFEVNEGDFLVILGPNGAGKTTLLKTIAGERPHSGHVLIGDGRAPREDIYGDPERWFRSIGQIPTENVLHEGLPVLKALEYVGKLRGVGRRLQDSIEKLLKEFGIWDKRHSLISKLSSGERKKVNICAELLTEPGLLLLDEPTTNLDPHAEKELMGMLLKRARNGTTIVVVSHTIRSLDLCNHIIFMGTSKIREEGRRIGVRRCWWWWWFEYGEEPQMSTVEEQQWIEDLPKKFKAYQTVKREPGSLPTKGRTFPSTTQRRRTHSATTQGMRVFLHHFWIVFARQIGLLYYEGWRIPLREMVGLVSSLVKRKTGRRLQEKRASDNSRRSILDRNWMMPWPLLVALAFGPLAGLLLRLTLPNEAFLESASLTTGMDAGDASTAAFLTGLVAFLMGILGTFREIAREITIYKHERLKSLRVKSYLLAKLSVYGLLYGLIAPMLMFLVLFALPGGSQGLPSRGLLLGGGGDLFVTLVLSSMTGVAMGLLVSSVGSSGEWATVLMGASVIFNAVLSGLVTNKASEKLINRISILIPSRWAMEGLKTSTEIYCWGIQWVLRDHYSFSHLSAIWLALAASILIALLFAYLGLHWKDKWFTRRRRLRLLVSQGNYIYLISCSIIVAMSWGLYVLADRAHEQEIFISNIDQLPTFYRIIGRINAAQCKLEQPTPPPLEIPDPTAAPTSISSPTTEPSPTPIVEATPTSGPVGGTPTQEPPSTAEPTPTPTSVPTPTSPPPSPVPSEFTVVVPNPADLYYSPTTQHIVMKSLPADSTFILLSRAQDGSAWIRAQVFDETGRGYVGWAQGNASPLSQHMPMVQLEPKTPPDCAHPVASTYRGVEGMSIAAGNLGNWKGNTTGDIAIVVDLYREEVGVMSDRLTLRFDLNGETVRTITVEPQQKRFLLQSGVYNLEVESGDSLSFVLTPSTSETLDTLHGYVSIFFIPQNCEFGEK